MEKKQQILNLVSEYILEQQKNKSWVPGEDWVEYSGPHFSDEEYVNAISSLLDGWLIFGKKCSEFEKEFPQHLGMKYGCLTNSGSSANLLMVATSMSKKMPNRLKKGDKVITPIVCFPTTINPIIQLGLTPVFVDVTIPSLNLDLDQVEEQLKQDPTIRGIIFAHVLGNPPDMDRLMYLVDKYNLVFLEDACDALGSFYKDKKLGSFGHISTCSFFPAHHMTMGEGGFVATNNNQVRMGTASIRDWGRACYCNYAKPGNVTSGTACGNRFKNWLPGMPDAVYDHRYVFDEIGYNLKPLDLQAAIGLQQVKKLPDLENARRRNFNRLYSIFSKYCDYFHLPEAEEGSDPCWFAFLLTVKENSGIKKEDFINHLEKAKIQTRSYFGGNILTHPGYQELVTEDTKIDMFPVANYVTMNSFFLGTFIGLTKEKLDYIESVVDSFFIELKK
jgi:CDP-4-dehydro-6-deoxyglucose reductase, E1